MEQWKEKLRKFGLKEWGMLLIAGLCCLIIVIPARDETEEQATQNTEYSYVRKEEETDYVTKLEQRLENLLSGVKGVGGVKVMITVDGSIKKTVLQDGTKETEQSTEQDKAFIYT